ncbi:MAG: hypothetical protein OXF60_08195 [Gammaproteobacteria bacterium]|nr:hypothetical protein [Gammaproteobacteria bacterium]
MIRSTGARRGIRTPDLLILTRYRFHDPDVLSGLGSGLSLHHTSRKIYSYYGLGGRCKVSTLNVEPSTFSTGLPFALSRVKYNHRNRESGFPVLAAST